MKYSKKWMQTFIDGQLPEDKVIVDMLSKKAFEVESVENTPDGDSVFEIKVLPNRIADALSIRGMARDLIAIFGLKEKKDIPLVDLNSYPLKNEEYTSNESGDPVAIFTGIKVTFDNSKPTPDWIKDILEKSGGRSINLLVDITNLMLFSFGQPAHVFDAQKVTGKITTRFATEGEELVLLDGKKIKLKSTDFVIADETQALSLAGIKGGKTAEVDTNTKVALFEMANFNPVMIRKSSQSLGIRTDASKVFENGITTAKTEECLGILLATIMEIDKESKVEYIINKKFFDKVPTPVSLTFSDVNNYAGKDIPKDKVVSILESLRFTTKVDGENIEVLAPNDRLDISMREDVLEEVLRIYGFDNLESKPLNLEKSINHNKRFAFETYFRDKLLKKGFTEIFSYAFQDEGNVKVKMGLAADKEYLRKNLFKGAVEAYNRNYLYLPILESSMVKFFELGMTFFDDSKEEKFGLICMEDGKKKSKYLPEIESLLSEISSELNIAQIEILQKSDKPAIVEFSIDKIVKELEEKSIEIPFNTYGVNIQDIKYKPISIYPFITRDIACFVPDTAGFNFDILKQDILNLNLNFCEKIYMFDRFEKEGKLSIAFRIIFQSYDKTLTDDEVEKEMAKVNVYLKNSKYEVR